MRQDFSLQNDLGVRRNFQIDGLALDERHRFLEHAADHIVLIDIERHEGKGADGKGRMHSQNDRDLQSLVSVFGIPLAPGQVHARGQMHMQPIFAHQHGAVETQVSHSR